MHLRHQTLLLQQALHYCSAHPGQMHVVSSTLPELPACHLQQHRRVSTQSQQHKGTTSACVSMAELDCTAGQTLVSTAAVHAQALATADLLPLCNTTP